MSSPAEARPKALGLTLEPDVYRALAYHARRHEMPVRDFIAFMIDSYLLAMKSASTGSSGGR